jgi:hypothetical protein
MHNHQHDPSWFKPYHTLKIKLLVCTHLEFPYKLSHLCLVLSNFGLADLLPTLLLSGRVQALDHSPPGLLDQLFCGPLGLLDQLFCGPLGLLDRLWSWYTAALLGLPFQELVRSALDIPFSPKRDIFLQQSIGFQFMLSWKFDFLEFLVCTIGHWVLLPLWLFLANGLQVAVWFFLWFLVEASEWPYEWPLDWPMREADILQPLYPQILKVVQLKFHCKLNSSSYNYSITIPFSSLITIKCYSITEEARDY